MSFAAGLLTGAVVVIVGLYVYIRTQMIKPPIK